MSQDSPESHSREVQMANDIGNFFRALPDREEAIAGIANHIRSFWTPRMREKLIAMMDSSPELDELPRAAMRQLMNGSSKPQHTSVGGDAG